MSPSDSDADPLVALAEEFAARYRRGERPSLTEYAGRHPELADRIRRLFPAMVVVEDLGSFEEPVTGLGAPSAIRGLAPRQLGDYHILREIGRGGMGVVYEAEQVSLGRRVALKVLPQCHAAEAKGLERFRREARAAARLHHTNIVPVFEVGQDGDDVYYAMQLIQGQGLDLLIDELRRLKNRAHPTGRVREPEPPDPPISAGPTAPALSRAQQVSRMAHSLLTGRFVPESPAGAGEAAAASGRREVTTSLIFHRNPDGTEAPPASEPTRSAVSSPPSTAVLPGGSQRSAVESGRRSLIRSLAHIGRQVATGLSYAHARGIVHRDIKPSNLLLDTEGVVWITDFGLAKAGDDGLTQTGDILGTIRYMAPERFRGEGNAQADVYALGLTLYELLTLRPAFDAPDRLQLIEQIKTEDPQRPRALDPRIPRDLETIVLKAMDKDPKARYQSADALAEDLRRFLDDEPIRARPVGGFGRAWRWARRNPAVASLLLFVGLLLAGVAVGASAVAYRAKQMADSERNARYESEAVQTFLVEDLLTAAAVRRASGGPPVTLADVLARAESRADRKFPDFPLVEAAVRETLGKVHYAMGQYDPAGRNLARAYDLRRHRDPLNRYTIRALELLALAAVARGDSHTLSDLERRTIDLATNPSRRIHTLGLVDAYSIHGRPERARDLLERILDADRTRLGAEHPITLADENTLGLVLRSMGKQDEAAARARRVLDIGGHALDSGGATAHDLSERMKVEAQLSRARVLLRNLDPRSRGERHPPLTIAAPYRATSPVADGEIGEGEYGPGLPIDFTADHNPGRLSLQSRDRTRRRDDLSFTLHAAHTLTDLFLAFRVRDQFLDDEISTDPVFNDMVEIFIDGDRVPNDFFLAGGSREGFQLITDTRGIQWTMAMDFFNVDWTVGTGGVEGEYIIEFKLPLDLIDTQDGPGFSPAATGSTLLMNAGIVDNDDDLQFVQEDCAYLWLDEPALSPFFGGEDTWVVALRLVP